jgi:hypothetical protein
MSVTIKTYLNFKSSEPEIRRFGIDADASTNYEYLVEKIRSVYPKLKREDLQLFWKGSVSRVAMENIFFGQIFYVFEF